MAYADSSLLLKLYLREPETPAALAAMGRASGPVFFTELHRLEIVNAIRRNLAAKRIRRSQALKALRTLRHDLRSGCYTLRPVDWPGVFRRAHRLSRRHAAKLAVRSLDLLHVLPIGRSGFKTVGRFNPLILGLLMPSTEHCWKP